MPLRQVAVALDWTPNTNHAGFYVAKAKGWYADAGIDVHFLSPHEDGYKETPASKLATGKATFALTPSETIVSCHTQAKPKIVAIAATLQTSASAVVALKASGIERPSQLDGKRYASYAARWAD
jgi:ABC-type nitrate/sulfonate/bicarbonate transport system substrate-binding protein